MRLSGAA